MPVCDLDCFAFIHLARQSIFAKLWMHTHQWFPLSVLTAVWALVQETVLAAASRRQLSLTNGEVKGSSAGGGAVAMVPAGSTHETFTDALVLFAGKTAWMLKMVNFHIYFHIFIRLL